MRLVYLPGTDTRIILRITLQDNTSQDNASPVPAGASLTLTTSCSVAGLVAPPHLPACLWTAPIAPGDKVQMIGGQENYDITRSLRALQAPTSSWRPFVPFDFALHALRPTRR